MTNNVDATVHAGVGNNADIVAKSIDIGAISHTDKPALGGVNIGNSTILSDNVIGDTGGLVSGAGGYSHTYLTLNTTVTIGDGAKLQVVGISSSDNVFSLHSLNDIHAYDSLKFTTAGALSGASAESIIKTLADVSQVYVGQNATLISSGAMNLSARGQGGSAGSGQCGDGEGRTPKRMVPGRSRWVSRSSTSGR